jgi:hypothetical protein
MQAILLSLPLSLAVEHPSEKSAPTWLSPENGGAGKLQYVRFRSHNRKLTDNCAGRGGDIDAAAQDGSRHLTRRHKILTRDRILPELPLFWGFLEEKAI